ncbi:GGDEF domain-containing protein [Alteromonas sp. CYL-A6]|uniref:GGDEF domain-containing protein n=1 Tax=Alteromonas nitratireducens TaxID=3390813 RepID=UPI0034B9A923
MSTSAFILFQAVLLAVIAVTGFIFTYALPVPSQKHKAKAAEYARLFLLTMTATQVCLSVRHLPIMSLFGAAFDPVLIYVLGFNLFAIVSAYLLYMTVVNRYGHAVRRQQRLFMVVHVLLLELASLYFYFVIPSETTRDLLMLGSCVIPVVMATHRIWLFLPQGSKGDTVLLSVLIATLVIICVCAPVYLTFLAGDEFEQTIMGLLMNVFLQLLFIMGFAVSVVQSLVNRLHRQVFTDALTKVHNRHFFYNMTPKLLENASRLNQTMAVIVCDIDHFKSVNDTHGHVVGDKVLRHFTTLLQTQLRKDDVLIRMGGEEFLILLQNCDGETAALLAERLREKVSASPLKHQNKSISITASFGVVDVAPGADLFKGVNQADEALYKAKDTGRNQVICVNGP